MIIDQGWATIFVRGPHCSFVSVSRAKFQSKGKVKAKKLAVAGHSRGPDVARGPYVAPSCHRL